jgi:DNA-binding IclR family transcriptional regulator
MARPALSASRTVALLNHLAAHRGESFTLTELTRELGVNSASLHAVLRVLEQTEYVVRDGTRKTYRLGPTLVAVGQVALDEHPAVRLSRERAAELAERLGLECLVTIPAGAEFLVVGVAGPGGRSKLRHDVGHRIPFMPPIGILVAGFLDDARREAWIDGLGPNSTAEDREVYRRAAAWCRRRGYEIGLDTPARQRILRVMLAIAESPLSPELHAELLERVRDLGREDHLLLDPEPGVRYPLDHIVAPIFGTRGEIVAGMTLIDFPEPLDPGQIDELVRLLTSAAADVTASTGGRIPLDVGV